MIVTFYNDKGGVGKTSLAYSIAKDLGFYLLSNDKSTSENHYEKAKYMQDIALIDEDIDIVYDLGGYMESQVPIVLEESDIIVVPTTLDANGAMHTLDLFESLKQLKYKNLKKVIFVLNRYDREDKKIYEEIVNEINDALEVLEDVLGVETFAVVIVETKLFKRASYTGQTVTEQFNNSNKLIQKNLKLLHDNYNILKNLIKGD